jgi:hypothetical protein
MVSTEAWQKLFAQFGGTDLPRIKNEIFLKRYDVVTYPRTRYIKTPITQPLAVFISH